MWETSWEVTEIDQGREAGGLYRGGFKKLY